MQKRAFVENNFEGVKCRIFDVSEKKLIKEVNTITEAANFLGISVELAFYTAAKKSRNKTNKLGKIITIRLSS